VYVGSPETLVAAIGCKSVVVGHCTIKFCAPAGSAASNSNAGIARVRKCFLNM
jgi:hypothetical protein